MKMLQWSYRTKIKFTIYGFTIIYTIKTGFLTSVVHIEHHAHWYFAVLVHRWTFFLPFQTKHYFAPPSNKINLHKHCKRELLQELKKSLYRLVFIILRKSDVKIRLAFLGVLCIQVAGSLFMRRYSRYCSSVMFEWNAPHAYYSGF